MGNLIAALLASTTTLRAYQNGLTVVQNNVANSSTPGYAKQVQDFRAQPFDPSRGLPGGVIATDLISYRDDYAERGVRQQQHGMGDAEARLSSLAPLEATFDISGEGGIAAAIASLFQSFSNWSVAPNSRPARQVVLDNAAKLARSFNAAAEDMTTLRGAMDRNLAVEVDNINRLLERLRDINRERRSSFRNGADPALETEYYSTLEKLSELVDFQAVEDPSGQTTILIGGQTTALVGDRLYPLAVEPAAGGVVIRNAQGDDITQTIRGGTVHGYLEIRNRVLPSRLESLNALASKFADSVNGVLAAGLDADGNAPAQNLFSYDAASGAAFTLRIEALDPSELSAALPGAPGGNGNAIKLVQLGNSREIDGSTFIEYYGDLAANVGRDLSSARQDVETRNSLLIQARSIRAESSAVSLDEEAVRLLEYQKAYEASAKMVSVLSDLTDTVLRMVK